MWEMLLNMLRQQKQAAPALPPPLRNYLDTLMYLAGGKYGGAPAVIDKPMGEGVYGEYRARQPMFGRHRDTISINSSPNPIQPLPRDYTLGHEFGHRLYYSNERLKSPALREDRPYAALQEVIMSLHRRSPYSNLHEGEPFAETFTQAMQRVRGKPYAATDITGTKTHEVDVMRVEDWIRERLKQYYGGAQQ